MNHLVAKTFLIGWPGLSALMLIATCQPSPRSPDIEGMRKYANALYEKELYPHAVKEYEALVDQAVLGEEANAGLLLRIGNIYLEKLDDPSNALAAFMKITEMYPASQASADAGRSMVECLEKMNRTVDARYEMSKLTALKPASKGANKAGKTVVAKIGERNISLAEVEKNDGYLGKTPAARAEQVQRYAAMELLHESALRKGYEKKKQFKTQVEALKKNLLINLVLEEALSQVGADSAFAKEYFEAHKERYTDSTSGKAPDFTNKKEQVIRDMMMEKRQKAYQDLIAGLLKADNVRIFDDRIK